MFIWSVIYRKNSRTHTYAKKFIPSIRTYIHACKIWAHSQNKSLSIHTLQRVNEIERDEQKKKSPTSITSFQTHVKREFGYSAQNKPITRSCSCFIQVCAVQRCKRSFARFSFRRPVWGRKWFSFFAKKKDSLFQQSTNCRIFIHISST